MQTIVMKMHSSKFKDPLISRAQPVTIISPIVEETLRSAGMAPDRERILELFMNGHPRVAVVHGGDDHPPSLGMKETIRRTIRQIWVNGALPFEIAQDVPCEELARGTDGAGYGLLSRNLCTGSLAAHMEAHSYDAAIVFGVCDKMLAGNLRALAETDLARQRRRAHPLFAMVIPSLISREVFATEEERRRFEPLRTRLAAPERGQLDELLHRPLKSEVYAGVKCLLDRCFHQRLVSENEKDDLEHLMARCTAVPGAGCAVSEASMVHRMMLAAFGIVPRGLDILVKPPSDQQLSDAIRRLLTAIQKRERRVSVAGLLRSNLGNAASVWSATGGHPAWILHLTYLADAVGKKLTIADVARKARTVPQILGNTGGSGNSVYTLALETENGGNSGIDTIMRTLAEKRLIEDRAPTLDGSWMQRIMDARSANGNFLHSTMTPFSSSCGMSGVHGNLCSWGVARMGWRGRSDSSPFRQEALSCDRTISAAVICRPILLRPTAFWSGSSTRSRATISTTPGWSTGQRTDSIRQTVTPPMMQTLEQAQALGLPGCRKAAARHGCRCRSRSACRRHAGTGSCRPPRPLSLGSMAVLVTDGRVCVRP